MKNLELLKTQIESIISDNKEYILSYTEEGNVLEYLHNDFAQSESGHHLYLTDEEIQLWDDSCEDDRVYFINEIEDFLQKYNFNLKDVIMTTSEINNKAKGFLINQNAIKIHSLLETFVLFPHDKIYYRFKGDLYKIEELEENFSIKILDIELL